MVFAEKQQRFRDHYTVKPLDSCERWEQGFGMFVQKVKAYMKRWQMLPSGSHVLAGVSGGADSVCLLLVLQRLQRELSIQVSVVHVHHGIRGSEADGDQAYTKALCEKLQVPCYTLQRDVPALAKEWHMSTEEAARKVRYEAFETIRADIQASHIAVAHHAEDQEETILMHLFRGCGLSGAAGMQPVNGALIRPLLAVSRAEIETYLTEEGIRWRTDSTNAETVYTRNFVRHQLMPLIAERFPQAGEQLRQFALLSGETDRYLKEQAEKLLESWGGVKKQAFVQTDTLLQAYVLRLAMEQAGVPGKDITAAHYRMLAELCEKPVGHRISLPGKYEAYVGYECLEFRTSLVGRRQETTAVKSAKPPELVMQVLSYEKNMKIPQNTYTKWFDYDKITEEVILRTRQSGDRFSPLPQGSKKLKDYMIDARIPREQRDQLWLVASGSEILWIIGYRISEAYKVTAQTKHILEIAVKIELSEEG